MYGGTLSGGMLGGGTNTLTALSISGWDSSDTNVRRAVRYPAEDRKTAASQRAEFTVLDIEGYPKKGNTIDALPANVLDRYGISRSKSTISESVKYHIPMRQDLSTQSANPSGHKAVYLYHDNTLTPGQRAEFFAELLARFRGESRYSGLSGETLGYINDVTRVAQKYEQAFIRAQRNVYRNAPSISGVNYSLKKGGKPLSEEIAQMMEEYFDKEKNIDNSSKGSIIKSVEISDFEPLFDNTEISKDCLDYIFESLGEDKKYFDKVRIVSIPKKEDGSIDLLRTNAEQVGVWADVVLEINQEAFKGHNLSSINERILKNNGSGRVVIKNLQEAVWHEAGHARLMYDEMYSRIEALTDELSAYQIEGISETAKINGDECFAECYVLYKRGDDIPDQAKKLFEKYFKE